MTTAPLVTATFGGRTFRCSPRTLKHLKNTRWKLRLRHPLAKLQVIQACYNGGSGRISASSGTHDFDSTFDFRIVGMDWRRAESFLRTCGWAAWWRHTGQWAPTDAWHIHAISIPSGLTSSPTALEVGKAYKRLGLVVGQYIDGGYTSTGKVTSTSQVVDYYHHALGLAGQHDTGDDPAWKLPLAKYYSPINKHVFKS